jgi:hypothetical protein
VGWLGFFVLCLVGLGLPLIFLSWLGNAGSRAFVAQLSRLAGWACVWAIGLSAGVLAVLALNTNTGH